MIKSQLFLMSWCTVKRQQKPWRKISLKPSLPASSNSKSRTIHEAVSKITSKRPACHVCSFRIHWNQQNIWVKKQQKKHHISGVFQLYLYQTSLLDNRCGHSAKDKKGKKTYFFLHSIWLYYKNNNSNYYFLLICKLNNIINK